MNQRNLIAVACLLALAGCGGSPEEAAPAAAPAPTGTAAAAAASVTTVAAVREGSGNAAVRVRFLLDKPPVVGQESQLKIDFNSYISGPVSVDVTFEGEQFKLAPEAATTTISLPRSGEDVSHMLALVPKVAGLSELKVRLKIVGEDAAEATYVIPVLADRTAPSDKPGPAREADNGNP